MEIPAPVLFHSYLTFGFGLFFIFQALANWSLIYRGESTPLIRHHFGLCLFSGLYSTTSTLLVIFHDFTTNLLLLHFMWISGSLIMYFYINSLRQFLKDESRNLSWIVKLPIISCLVVVGDLVYWKISGATSFAATEPIKTYNNMIMNFIGGMNPGELVKFIFIYSFRHLF